MTSIQNTKTVAAMRKSLKITSLWSQVRRQMSRAGKNEAAVISAAFDFLALCSKIVPAAACVDEGSNSALDDGIYVGEVALDLLRIADFLGRDPNLHYQVLRSEMLLMESQLMAASDLIKIGMMQYGRAILEENGLYRSEELAPGKREKATALPLENPSS